MIYVTGDTHIPIDTHKLASKRFCAGSGDYVIICGDFGGVFSDSNEEKYWRKWLDKKPYTTLFIDGNHENFDLLSAYPEVEFSGARAHKISDKIYHIMRGSVLDLDGVKIFAFGGGESHDKEHRTEGKNWWREEMPSDEEMQKGIANLEGENFEVDFVITHTAPTSLQPKFSKNPLSDYLEEVKAKLKYKKWYFGHYHIDEEIDMRHTAIFNKIKTIGD